MILQATINGKGQLTIPSQLRKKLQITPKVRLTIIAHNDTLTIRKTDDFFALRGSVPTTKPFDAKRGRKEFATYFANRKQP